METNLQYCLLRNLDLFNFLNENELKELCSISEFKKLKKDAIIYHCFGEINKLYILNQGRIKIAYGIEKNVEVVSEILIEGDIFGELTLKINSNSNNEFAQVMSDETLVTALTIEGFEHILKKNAQFAFYYSQMVAEKLKIISGKYRDLVFKNVKERVLNFFILHARYEGKWSGDKAVINMFCTHRDIANFTASTRQTVTSIINTLVKEKKIIYEGRSKVVIPDIKKLEA